MMEKQAVSHCRVSSKEQAEEGYSLDAQEKLLQEYATGKLNATVARVFRIKETASKHEVRKQFQEMLAYVIENKIKIILCEKIDRLTRNFKDAATINDWVNEDPEREVHFVKENSIVRKNTKAHENLVWDMKVSIARFYTNNLSEEVKKGQIEKLQQGWMPKGASLGYKTDGEVKHKIHIINADVAPYVKEIFDLYSTGLYSLTDLADLMYEKGFRSVNGMKVSHSNIRMLLKNTFYYGEIVWNGIHYQGKHEPLISKDLFDQCQTIMTGTRPDKYVKHNPLFKGLVNCGDCNHKVSWYEKKGFWYGRCANYRICQQAKRPIKEESLVEQMFPFFENLRLSEADILAIKQNLQKDHQSEIETRTTLVNDLKRKIERVNTKMTVLYEDRLDGRITPTEYDTKKKELEAESLQLQGTLKKIVENAFDYYDFGINLMELARKLKDLFPFATKEEKQEIFTLAFQQMRVKEKTLEIDYTPWFAKLKNHLPELQHSCELLKQPTNKEQNRTSAVVQATWLAYINDLRTLGDYAISRVQRMGQLLQVYSI